MSVFLCLWFMVCKKGKCYIVKSVMTQLSRGPVPWNPLPPLEHFGGQMLLVGRAGSLTPQDLSFPIPMCRQCMLPSFSRQETGSDWLCLLFTARVLLRQNLDPCVRTSSSAVYTQPCQKALCKQWVTTWAGNHRPLTFTLASVASLPVGWTWDRELSDSDSLLIN